MTGKELIIYILQNGLEDTNIFKDGMCECFMTAEQVAVAFGVGVETVNVMEQLDLIRGIKIGSQTFFPKNMRDPRVLWPDSKKG